MTNLPASRPTALGMSVFTVNRYLPDAIDRTANESGINLCLQQHTLPHEAGYDVIHDYVLATLDSNEDPSQTCNLRITHDIRTGKFTALAAKSIEGCKAFQAAGSFNNNAGDDAIYRALHHMFRVQDAKQHLANIKPDELPGAQTDALISRCRNPGISHPANLQHPPAP